MMQLDAETLRQIADAVRSSLSPELTGLRAEIHHANRSPPVSEVILSNATSSSHNFAMLRRLVSILTISVAVWISTVAWASPTSTRDWVTGYVIAALMHDISNAIVFDKSHLWWAGVGALIHLAYPAVYLAVPRDQGVLVALFMWDYCSLCGCTRQREAANSPFVTLLSALIQVASAVHLAAVAFTVTEGRSYPDSLYWAVTTVSTVGYGDVTPGTSTAARTVTMTVQILGVFVIARLTAAVAEYNASVPQASETKALSESNLALLHCLGSAGVPLTLSLRAVKEVSRIGGNASSLSAAIEVLRGTKMCTELSKYGTVGASKSKRS